MVKRCVERAKQEKVIEGDSAKSQGVALLGPERGWKELHRGRLWHGLNRIPIEITNRIQLIGPSVNCITISGFSYQSCTQFVMISINVDYHDHPAVSGRGKSCCLPAATMGYRSSVLFALSLASDRTG